MIAKLVRTFQSWLRGLRGMRNVPPPEDPPAGAGVRSPLQPLDPLLSGAAARSWPPSE